MDFKRVHLCRVCGSKRLRKYLDLGRQPLANQLSDIPVKSKKYPLQVLFCQDCHLSQLSIVVNPDILYRKYLYHSSVSETFKKHCHEMAVGLRSLFPDSPAPMAMDIASNDGCLLSQFKKLGFDVMGIEPCQELALEAGRNGIPTINDFWNEPTAKKAPLCNVITATNVLAHVNDLPTFLRLVKSNLNPSTKGIFIAEFPYLPNLFEGNQFDTIYHEHLSYFLLSPLVQLFSSCGIPIFKVEKYPIHGGSIRIYASP